MKKLFAILLSLVMLFSLTATAFAVTGEFGVDKGSITINKYNEDNEYSIYRMLNLQSFDTAGQGTYSYTINTGWEEFFTTGEGAAYVTIESGYVTWKTGLSDTVAPEFAKKALAYAKSKSIAPVAVSDKTIAANRGTIIVDGQEFDTYKFSDLELGYYLVDSTMGALCGLTTTNPNASINAKNGEPTLSKDVKEDSVDQWGANNTADIGQTVEYRITITVEAGAEGFVLHDAMSEGLTFNPSSVSVTYDGGVVVASNYTVKTSGFSDTCDFEVEFSPAFCSTLAAGKSLIVFYTATVNENAVVAGSGNTNTATLEFGEEHRTTPGQVTTYTYAFDLVKTDAQNSLLAGAKFKMYHTETGGTPVELVKVTSGSGYYYRPALNGETGITEFEVENGMIRFQGFDPGDYYFEETEAPAGYNQLTARAKFTLPAANKDAIFNAGIYSSGSGFHITNQTGSMLPETGALGTVLFTVLGSSTALGTGVVLVTKKRMSKIKDEDEE